ncbi:carboxylesterase family protein [Seiridium cupressi]
MGQGSSSPLADCLNNVCNGRSDCVAYPDNVLYQASWVKPYNLDLPVTPIAVTRPESADDVSGFIKCAVSSNIKVQAKSGGHSYANYGLGGTDGELVLDLQKMTQFSMDTDTWQATMGAGHRLSDVTQELHDNGKRAMSHGTCPGVGIGGHATIGGLGPTSRMWGSCLDHVLEVEVVTADGTIQRANETFNSDLFFALKGAGAGFGVITEFVVKTHPEPGSVVQYSFTATFGKHADMADVFEQWQTLISDPNLDRRFGSEVVMYELGLVITATFYGTEDEFNATGIPDKIPAGKISVVLDDWLGVVAEQAEDAALYISDLQSAFTSKSLAFREDELLTRAEIDSMMSYLDNTDRGTPVWFLIFDVTGGAISDIPMNATAYSHRDKIMFCQGYGVGLLGLTQTTRDFMNGLINEIQSTADQNLTTYPGYVDPALTNAQESYWGPNLARLGQIKSSWDPTDIFHNPQSHKTATHGHTKVGLALSLVPRPQYFSAYPKFSFIPLLALPVAQAQAPTAQTLNGTYQGRYLADWDQDAFLGIPYAQPPVGSLRYRWPQSINESFDDVRDATQYGYSCMQYATTFNISEDCLTVNVIRPAGNFSEPLPVLVWIFGGGLYTGSTADPQYNLSGIVKVSQDVGKPFIAVSINYRLGMWGFLQTAQILAEGSSNAGLLDQRLALHWIQENIDAFGGNPEEVVIWGESAGAQSVAYHLFAYDGRDDGLFRGAIMESGGPTGAQVETLSWYNSAVENLTRAVGCWGVTDQLACLRSLGQATLFAAHPSVVWNPLLDGDFLTGYPSQLIEEGKYNAVPIITGANTDETFAISGTPNTEEDIFNSIFTWRSYPLTPPTVRKLFELYPDDPCYAVPYAITNCTRHPTRGLQWRRAASIGSDLVMVSQRRKMAELYTSAGVDVYSYRFDQRLWNGAEWDGVKHFQNVAFSFQNISGLLGPSPQYDSHLQLAKAIGQAYTYFVNDLDPNGTGDEGTGKSLLPAWPKYDLDAPKNIVLNATENWVEDDTWRKEGIAFINTPEVSKELLG